MRVPCMENSKKLQIFAIEMAKRERAEQQGDLDL
jgi:hypothetical protein